MTSHGSFAGKAATLRYVQSAQYEGLAGRRRYLEDIIAAAKIWREQFSPDSLFYLAPYGYCACSAGRHWMCFGCRWVRAFRLRGFVHISMAGKGLNQGK